VVAEAGGADRTFLLNEELDSVDCNRALRVVDMDYRFCDFLGRVDIFFVGSPHFGDALVDTATSGDLALFFLLFVHLESHWCLPDRQDLLVLHYVLRVSCVQCSLDVVLYLGLGAFTD
jgi:hypothetical protein